MRAERWRRLEELFFSALSLPAAARATFLDDAVSDDAELREEIDSLLDAHAAAEQLTCSGGSTAERRADSSESRRPIQGRRVSGYRLLRELGRGGMGAVFLAARDDEEFERLVAVKVLAANGAGQVAVHRFRSERQILARLEHPNIATLYEGGSADDGRPYFAMEYVPGLPITDYCRLNDLPLGERLALFLQVCQAISYAHRNLVVHRDIKPSNILIQQGGAPKLLDFGIAKLLDADLDPGLTRTGLRPLTPQYASPEQLQGGSITTASDIFSLGVVLYELLTGRLPHEPTLSERMEQILTEQEPKRPSTLVAEGLGALSQPRVGSRSRSSSRGDRHAARLLSRRLAGDLDAIVMRTLRQDPAHRYPSVDSLIEDLNSFASGRPVSARRGSLAYRAVKFARRHRLVVAAAGLVVALGITFLFTTRSQNRKIARERDKALGVSSFLVDMFEVSNPDQQIGSSVTARQLLDLAARRIDLEFEDNPDLRATLLDTVGSVYMQLGMRREARKLLERGLQLRSGFFGDDHLETADSLHSLASLALAESELDEAEALAARALKIRRRYAENDDPLVAASLDLLGDLAFARQDLDRAEDLAERSLAIRRSRFGDSHRSVGESLLDLATVLEARGRLSDAESLVRESLDVQRRVLGDEHPEIAQLLDRLASLRYLAGDFAGSERGHRRALELKLRFLPEDHPLVADSLLSLGRCAWRQARFEEAEAHYRQALEILRRVLPGDHEAIATSLNNMGMLYKSQGKHEEAERALRESLAMNTRLYGDTHAYALRSRHNLAGVLDENGDFAGAEREYRRLLAELSFLGRRPEAALPRVGYARLLLRMGRPEAAEPLLREAFSTLSEAYEKDHWRIGEVESLLGIALARRGAFDEAESYLLRGFAVLRSQEAENEPRARNAAEWLVELYEGWGKPEQAELYRQAIAELEGVSW